MIRIELHGPIRGKGRPRFVRATGRTYTPKETASYENLLAWTAQQSMGTRDPIVAGVPVAVAVEAVFAVPASWGARKRSQALEGLFWPTKKPDADNILKMLDALNGIVWHDDAQIVACTLTKRFGGFDHLVIEVEEVLPEIARPAA